MSSMTNGGKDRARLLNGGAYSGQGLTCKLTWGFLSASISSVIAFVTARRSLTPAAAPQSVQNTSYSLPLLDPQ